MIILTIRTDNPMAEVGLFDGDKKLAYKTWQAHHELAGTIHSVIDELLHARDKTLRSIGGIVVFQGPGSFTGLRIGITVANTLAAALAVPLVGTRGKEWAKEGLYLLKKGEDDHYTLPEYGAPVHITPQKR